MDSSIIRMAAQPERSFQDDELSCENDSVSTQVESPMETESEIECDMKPSSSLQMMLSSIADERNKSCFVGGRMVSEIEGSILGRPI